MVEINYNKGLEKIEKQGEPKFVGQSTAKDMRGWIQGRINICMRRGLVQEEFFFREVLNAYNHYEPIKEVEVEVEKWKGKSSFEIIKEIDKLIIIKYQKKDKDSEPIEIRTEISKRELTAVITAIKKLSSEYDKIETKLIARGFCEYLGITKNDKGQQLYQGDFWINFFGWRSAHNKLTLILDALQELNLIEYKGGFTRLLNKDISIQLVLP